MDAAMQHVLLQAPAEATAEDARAALDHCRGDTVAAVAYLWEGPEVADRLLARAPRGMMAAGMLDEKDRESLGKIAEMREMCDRMNIQMNELLRRQPAAAVGGMEAVGEAAEDGDTGKRA